MTLHNLEVVSQNGTGVRFRGWALDPDTSASIPVHAYVTPQHGVATTAEIDRPDVGAEHTASGSGHGFDVTRGGIVAGTYNVCAYGINAPGTPGGNTTLGCQSFTVTQSPIGRAWLGVPAGSGRQALNLVVPPASASGRPGGDGQTWPSCLTAAARGGPRRSSTSRGSGHW